MLSQNPCAGQLSFLPLLHLILLNLWSQERGRHHGPPEHCSIKILLKVMQPEQTALKKVCGGAQNPASAAFAKPSR